MTESTQGRDATRARVLAAGLGVFAEKGISRASIGDICERAGFTRGAFYSNFASKEELFMELYRAEIAHRIERLARSFEQATTELDRSARSQSTRWLTRGVFDAFAADHARDESWFVMVCEAEALGLRDRELGRQLAAIRSDFLDEIAATIGERLRVLELELTMPIDDAVVVIADLYESMLKSSMLTGTFPTARASAEALVPRILAPLIRARAASQLGETA